jgi:hypothetical protein
MKSSSDTQSLQALANVQQQHSKTAASRRITSSSKISAEPSSLQSLVNEQLKTPSRRLSASNIIPSDLAALQTSLSTLEHLQQQVNQRHSANIVTSRTTPPSAASELATLQAMQNHLQQRQNQQRRASLNAARNNADLAALMHNTEGRISPARVYHRGNAMASNPVHRRFSGEPTHQGPQSVQERQAVNRKLQEQILDNIHQQQQLMRELMVGKSQQANRPASMPMRLNIANPKPTTTNNSLAHLMNHSSIAGPLMNDHRQLPMNLLEQSLARGTSLNNEIMMQRRNSNTYHASMPPPNRQSPFDDQHGLSRDSFNW